MFDNAYTEEATGDLLISIRIKNAAQKDKDRISVMFPIFVNFFPITSWMQGLKSIGTLLAIFS